ncbi:ras-associating and dilute domain-containing protein isoform X2 [Pseudorasbora parva]|uniref:ras-associating and dilute domain-containing protein isoform X2 n=1 Tax=Pseudorasbora parva TaxID=51549 RepID=UPI00351ED4AD
MLGHERSSPASAAGLPGLPSRRRLSRLGRKTSSGSVQSSSSSGTGRSTESVGIRQPAKSKIRRQQQRLSAVFGPRRASAEMTEAAADDPSELSNHVTAPGILKIFGTEICEGANYKSVLATTHSSAKELVKEALARYSLSKEEADEYVLCDVIGCVENQSWRTECVRVVGDHEKPLLLQSLWKPREGFARRFEIQQKATVEENNSKDKDTVTAGINAQARKLQKTRSRGKSVCDAKHNLLQSLSEPQLNGEAHSGRMDHPEADKAAQCPEAEDNRSQFSIHPPLDFPYFLLLQGFSHTQDFVIYPLLNRSTVFGRRDERTEAESDAEMIYLWAPDLLPHHCSIRTTAGGLALIKPTLGANIKRNGATVSCEVELHSGDIIGFGDHYLFMYKDPTACNRPPLCETCVFSHTRSSRGFRDPDGDELALLYEAEFEPRILEEIFSTVEQDKTAHKLTAAFLLCLCVQQSANHFSMPALRRLLLQTANQLQTLVWEKAKELAALQPEIRSESDADAWLIRGLEPMVLWMANSVQILHFIHQELPRLLRAISEDEEEEEEDCMAVLELRLSSVRSASEEAMTVLEEVLMFTFQQCVYYLTKMLYPLLPGFLDSNAFSELGQLQVSEDIRRVLDICTHTLQLLRALHLHPQLLAQLFSYLFFFINALLFNLLMERGSGGRFYHWSRGVQIRANLDLLMDWAHGAGLADLAQAYLLKLSSAVNLLATPKENLLQMCWKALRMEFASLNAAQLHHMLSEYNPQRSCAAAWTPSSDETGSALTTADILESFDQHPPLVLPSDGFVFELRRPISDRELIQQLHRFQRLVEKITHTQSSEDPQLVPTEAKLSKLDVHPKAQLELVFPHGWDSCEALLTKKLQNLELQHKDDPSCLLTPPNTPQNLELTDSDTDSNPQTAGCIAAGESAECEVGEDVFVLELQRAVCGLGLMLVDGQEAPFSVSGIYIKSILPDSPAALSQRLREGDRILAVNGLDLAGVDYQTGLELIQKSGDKPRLLVSRSCSTTKETRTKLPA